MNKKFYYSPKLNIDKINFDDILAASNIEIKDNLKGLITLLNNIKKVRDRFYTIKKKYQNKEINKKIYLEKCNECLDDLDNIKLGIKLKQKIRVEIENSINEIDK